MKKPLLSIIVPNYNHAPYLSQTLDSILAQDFDDFELIVGDDASTDSSVDVMASYEKCIRSFYFKKNRGYFAIISDLFQEVRGQYVHIFSSDDLYMPGFLSRSMRLMLEENLTLTCSDIRYFSQSGSRDTQLLDSNSSVVFNKRSVVQNFRNSNFWVPGVSCITAIEILKKYGLPNPRLENISDWFLFHHIALFEGIGYIPHIGIAMREQEGSYTSQVKKDRKRRNATYWAVLDIVSKDRLMRKRFRDAAILTFIFDNLFWKLIVRPQWWDFFVCSKLSVWGRLGRSLKKRLQGGSIRCRQKPS